MNALARIVRDLVSGREPSQADLDGLNHQELAALRELRASVALSPRETARVLAQAVPQEDWLSAPKAARQVAC
jgi:hypothetical protein